MRLLVLTRFTARVSGACFAVALLVAACGEAHAAGSRNITLTLVRHAQSTANAAGTIGYELLTKVTARVPRRYIT